jgi:hypothetical protein
MARVALSFVEDAGLGGAGDTLNKIKTKPPSAET